MNSFVQLPMVETLDLSLNSLSYLKVGMFENIPTLRNLYVTFNQITGIEKGAFKKLNNLSKLQLFGNKMSQLNWEVFYNLPKLRRLHLQNNYITEIDHFPYSKINLSLIDLSGNPLNCSCNTFSALSNMMHNGINVIEGWFKTPAWLYGFTMNDVIGIKSIAKYNKSNYPRSYNMSIGCSSTSKVCPQNNNTIDCVCVEQLTDGTRTCSSQHDCRIYGCKINKACIINNHQWKCSEILSTYICNNTECYNNGKCIPHERSFICQCRIGFNGTFCETDLNTDFDSKTIIFIVITILLIFILLAVIFLLCYCFKKKKTDYKQLITNPSEQKSDYEKLLTTPVLETSDDEVSYETSIA